MSGGFGAVQQAAKAELGKRQGGKNTTINSALKQAPMKRKPETLTSARERTRKEKQRQKKQAGAEYMNWQFTPITYD